ncbi:tRNA uridine-5-carboxymethylaminomethyl(34) synthesis GTPase MnmE [Candidatus Dependentiae bacterium]|nr:tRNA uridine-5-carboxymethylaminomethyl(34) synthesis GTPase MnmE [Candidatus Dependentiae bacterium]
MDERPIIALCTPQGSGAIALIRVCGTEAIELVDKMARLSSGQSLTKQKTHTIHHGHIIDQLSPPMIIDEVLFLLMRTPRTFTSQDTVEITCHNNPFIINQIIKQAISLGAHQAQRGEFTKRAVLNQKIDLLQAEAINDLISAQTELALKKSMAQHKGTLSHQVQQVEDGLISLLTIVEASFEFLDEEQQDVAFDNIIRQKLKRILEKTNTVLESFSAQKQIRQGIKIALLGSVNVGKSTLFNALVKHDRAIVTNVPGTTRDAIETTVHKNGSFWLLVDTAGLRQTDHAIEQKGIERAWQEAAQSDIILLVHEAQTPMTEHETKLYNKIKKEYVKKVIIVASKVDQVEQPESPPIDSTNTIFLSAKTKIGLDKLEQAIEEKIKELFQAGQAPFLLNQRQHNIISQLHKELAAIETESDRAIQHEVLAHQLKQQLELVAQLTGKEISERVMNSVFSTFCVGK